MGATEAVAGFACTHGEPAPGHREAFTRAVLDTVGSALAGAGTDVDVLLRRYVMAQAGAGQSTVWATGARAPTAAAALLNGTLGHAQDWDDVSPATAMHPSVVLIPALLAVAEAVGSDGTALVDAHDVGAAVFRAVARALPRLEHYRRGWHTTATVGRLAAVAALVRLLDLNEPEARAALGLAGSLAGGTLANFGTMTKPLHAGLAARDAVMATALARIGFTANPDHLEARAGFFDVFGDSTPALRDSLGADLDTLRVHWPEDWGMKLYPACYATHRAIDAALELRAGLAGRPPRAVEVVVEPGGLLPLRAAPPVTSTQAKFSMGYVVAAAFVRGHVQMADFTDTAIADEKVRSVMARISAREAPSPPVGDGDWRDGFAVLCAREDDGTRTYARVDHARGSAAVPLSDAEIEAKFFEGCAIGGLDDDAAGALRDALRALPATADLTAIGRYLGERTCGKGT